MARTKPEPRIVLIPRNDRAKVKLSYHTDRWLIRGEEVPKFSRSKGMCYVCRSPDGKQIIFVQKENDPDFDYRII